jgi:antitoxin (DNA-binding transcriptional repressor) of toxin-antitoxin stability system
VKTVTVTDSISWDQLMQQINGEEVQVLRDGHPVALLTPFDDDDLEWYVRKRDPGFLASIAKARQQAQQGKTLSHGDLKKELGID